MEETPTQEPNPGKRVKLRLDQVSGVLLIITTVTVAYNL